MSPGTTSVLTPARPPAVVRTAARPRHGAPFGRSASARRPSAGAPSGRGLGFRPELEGLRAIAVIGVVLYHAGFPLLPGGYVGVDVFFVLSGYLITGLLLSEVVGTGRLSLSRFYARRIRRLLPAAALVLTATAAACSVALPAVQRSQVAGDIMSAALYVSNWRFAAQATDYLASDSAPSPVLHYWSLGVEEQFYVIWPLVIVGCLLLLRRFAGRGYATRTVIGWCIAGIAVVSLLWGVALTSTNESVAFFGTFTRIWELAAGAVVAVIGSRILVLTHAARAVLAWLGLLVVVGVMVRYDGSVAYPGWAALLPVLGTVAVIAGCTTRVGAPRPGPAGLLSYPRLRHFGRVSYSWYLWHWPLLVIPAVVIGHELSWWQSTLAVLVSYLLAVVSFRYVESSLRFSPALARTGASVLLAVGLTVVSVLAALGLARSGDDPAALTGVIAGTDQVRHDVFDVAPSVTVNLDTGAVSKPKKLTPSAAEAPDDDFQALYDGGCQAGLLDTSVPSCVMGKKSSSTTMVVFGDSHAAAWAPALDIVAVKRGWRMVPITKVGCAAALFPVWNPQVRRETPECDQWRQNAIARIKSLHPALIVVANRWKYQVSDSSGNQVAGPATYGAVADGTAAMLRQLRSTGAQLIYLRDVPLPGFDGPSCVSKNGTNYAACDFSRAAHAPQNSQLMSEVKATPGVQIVDLDDVVCPPAQVTCPVVEDNILRYRDSNHMTATYARTLAPELLARFPAKL